MDLGGARTLAPASRSVSKGTRWKHFYYPLTWFWNFLLEEVRVWAPGWPGRLVQEWDTSVQREHLQAWEPPLILSGGVT